MRLLFVIDEINHGGAAKMIISVAAAMAEDYGHESVLHSYASAKAVQVIPDSVRFVPGTEYLRNRVLRHPAKIPSIRRVIKQIEPDVIVCFMPYPSILTILASIGLHQKIVACERGDPAVYGGFIKLLGHRIISTAAGGVFQLEGARRFYGEPFYSRTCVIPNAVTIQRAKRLPWSERNDEIAFVGRMLIPQKRQDLAISAFAAFKDDYPNMTLVLYGDGDDLDIVKQLVEDSGLEGRVRFAGQVSNIIDRLLESKLFVLASDYEGIPNALIEAMCVGLPCVATDCTPGGAAALIENGINGLLVSRGDSKAIEAACRRLLSNREFAEQLGTNAQESIYARLSKKRIYKEWNEYLVSILFA